MMYYKQYLASCRRAHPTKGVQSPEPGRSSQSRDARMPRVVRPHRSPLGSHRVRAGRKTSGAIEGEVLFAGQKLSRATIPAAKLILPAAEPLVPQQHRLRAPGAAHGVHAVDAQTGHRPLGALDDPIAAAHSHTRRTGEHEGEHSAAR